MAVESATFVSELNSSYPAGSEIKGQGDNHLRLIKAVLQSTFPTADHILYLEGAQADVASATTTDLGAQTTNYLRITGTTTITGFGTVAAGVMKFLRFAAALTLTHNATSLILPGGANITTAADDRALAVSLGSGNWLVLFYQRAASLPLSGTPGTDGDLAVWNASGNLVDGPTPPSGDLVGDTDSQTLTNKTLTDPAIIGAIAEDIYTITDGAGFEIDPSNGTLQRVTLGADRTPAATNFANGESVTLMVDDGSARTITWSTVGVVWIGGSAPTLETSGWTVIELWKEGNVIRGALVGAAAS